MGMYVQFSKKLALVICLANRDLSKFTDAFNTYVYS